MLQTGIGLMASRWLLLVALVSSGTVTVVSGLPTITTITVRQPVLDGFEFEPALEFSWPPGSLPPAGTSAGAG